MTDIPEPRFWYCGIIGKRLNLELLDELARQRPEYSLVLVGRVDERGCVDTLAKLRQRDNVYFLGEKPVDDVPAYVSSFQAGLLPYELNLETASISPLKMYEYLAAGLPVISTPIPAAEKHREYVTVCATADSFIEACSLAVSTNDDAVISQRRHFAERNSWDARVEQIRQLIQAELPSGSLSPATAVTS